MPQAKKSKKIGVSVIVPCYKRIKQTIRTLNLIFNSEGWRKQYEGEVIVADSTRDDSLKGALFKKFKEKKRKGEFFYLKPKKIGISCNKNAGAKKARFPILIFCDSDIEIEKNTILKSIKALKKHNRAGAITGKVIWKGGKKDGQLDRPKKEDRMIKEKGTYFVENIFSRYKVTYKKVFFEVGGYDEEVFNMRGEGSDLSIRYWRAGYPLAYDPSLKVHHIAEAPDSIALRVKHPEWGIIKDLLLLAYKYDLLDEETGNFSNTIMWVNFSKFGKIGYFRILQGIGQYLDFIIESKRKIDKQKKEMRPRYNFKFFEIFDKKSLFKKCLRESEKRLQKIRKNIFD